MKTDYRVLTPAELRDQCPAGYAQLEQQCAQDPSLTPIDACTLWYAGGTFHMQDPADTGFSNVSLQWDGECWG